MAKLKRFGYHIIEAASGLLACGDTGIESLPSFWWQAFWKIAGDKIGVY